MPDNTEFQQPRQEHRFAQYVRILGKGKTGSRSLTRTEAHAAFAMILADQVDPLQLGAFLMLLRVKEESPDELAGFVTACREAMTQFPAGTVADLDWSSYAGKKAQQPWYLLSALLLADNGVRVAMHGADGHTAGRLYTEQVLVELGIAVAGNLTQAVSSLERSNFAYLPLRNFCAPLDAIMQFRHLLGLRSPVNTLARLLNPLAAPHSIQSVFHPAYADLHQRADALLGQPAAMVFKGEGGEVEIKPQADTRVALMRDGRFSELIWPRTLAERPTAAEQLDASHLRACWRGSINDDYGRSAVIATTAAALLLLAQAPTPGDATALADDYWINRNRERC